MTTPPITIYTDGACSGNPGPGGWAWAIPGGRYAAGPAARTTNQRMEIQAAYEALLSNGDDEQPVVIVSDSTYVVNCFRDRWWEGWIRRGWKNSQKQPVANRDLWEPFVDLVRARGNVRFDWVKGHSGDPMNDLVDRLAVAAAQTQTAATGTADLPGGSAVGSRRRPADAVEEVHDLLVVGHADRDVDAHRGELAVLLADRRSQRPNLRVVTGLRRGAEALAAEVAGGEQVPYLAVLPFPEPDAGWSDDERARFRSARDAAVSWIVLDDRAPGSRQRASAALRRRDAWFNDNVHEAVVLWDGEDERIGKVYRSLVDSLGADLVHVITVGAPRLDLGVARGEGVAAADDG